jgi:hypothetical protein
MKRVLLVFPTAWDRRQLAALAPGVRARYEVVPDGPADEDVRWDLDVLGHIEARARSWRGALQGVTSSSDYPGAIVAAALAEALRLPGSPPEAVLRAGHKYYSRLVQREVVPEAVPDFALLDPDDPATWPRPGDFPRFVKPVKASFSLFARRVADGDELAALLASPALREFRDYHGRLFDLLAGRYTRFEHGSRWFVSEGVLTGQQVTVEGWVQRGRASVLGVVDTGFHPGTTSFARFDYPSALPEPVQDRLGAIACRVAEALRLDHTLFNVEMFHDGATGKSGIVELNPRPCGQFYDLYEKVDGTNGLEVALALATGEPVTVQRRRGRFAAAASFPLRVFESVRVRRAPEPGDLRRVEAEHPGSLVWSDVQSGDRLHVGRDSEDGSSVRYAILNLGAEDRSALEAKRDTVARALGFELEREPAAQRGPLSAGA